MRLHLIHVGRRCPKGFTETEGATHLGRGMWMLQCVMDGDAAAIGKAIHAVRSRSTKRQTVGDGAAIMRRLMKR